MKAMKKERFHGNTFQPIQDETGKYSLLVNDKLQMLNRKVWKFDRLRDSINIGRSIIETMRPAR